MFQNSISCALRKSPRANPRPCSTPRHRRRTTGLEGVLDIERNTLTTPSDLQLRGACDPDIVNHTFNSIAPDWTELIITNECAVAPSKVLCMLFQLYDQKFSPKTRNGSVQIGATDFLPLI